MENVTLKKMINAYGMVLILILLFLALSVSIDGFFQLEQYGVLSNRYPCLVLLQLA